MALNLWEVDRLGTGRRWWSRAGCPETLEQGVGALAWRGGQTTSGLFFVLRGLWPVALGGRHRFQLKQSWGKNCEAGCWERRKMHIERAQLCKITCSPLW